LDLSEEFEKGISSIDNGRKDWLTIALYRADIEGDVLILSDSFK